MPSASDVRWWWPPVDGRSARGRCSAVKPRAWRPATFASAPSSSSPRATWRVRQLASMRSRAMTPSSSRRGAFSAFAWPEHKAMLIAQWMKVGFIHGVMNTDNMSRARRRATGPALPRATRRRCSARTARAAAFGSQPAIALEHGAPGRVAAATARRRPGDGRCLFRRYRHHLLGGQCAKLGLQAPAGADDSRRAGRQPAGRCRLHAGVAPTGRRRRR